MSSPTRRCARSSSRRSPPTSTSRWPRRACARRSRWSSSHAPARCPTSRWRCRLQPIARLPGETISSSFLAAGLLNWEIDLWGRIRRGTEAAQADLAGREAARDGARVSLIAQAAIGALRARGAARDADRHDAQRRTAARLAAPDAPAQCGGHRLGGRSAPGRGPAREHRGAAARDRAPDLRRRECARAAAGAPAGRRRADASDARSCRRRCRPGCRSNCSNAGPTCARPSSSSSPPTPASARPRRCCCPACRSPARSAVSRPSSASS